MKPFANSLLVLVLFIVPLAVARAATPADELLRLVPEDVGFCLVVQDLRSHSAAFLQSPFFRRLSEAGFGPAGAPELAKLAEVEKEFKKHLNVDWARLRDDIFGDAVVFAYRPGPPGKPHAEQGLVLVRARDAKLLADLIERLNTLQKVSGDLKELEERITPREETWDPLLKMTGAPGIYYSDFPELSGFKCPEWSHLSAGDSVEFSKRLVSHLRDALNM